jgi:hypothetical protein
MRCVPAETSDEEFRRCGFRFGRLTFHRGANLRTEDAAFSDPALTLEP